MAEFPGDAIPNPTAGGWVVINADDWGRDRVTTDRILDCALAGTLSSASAMVFMDDSERAAVLAREHKLDTGLHLNFTTPFSAADCPAHLLKCQQRVATYLTRHRLARVLFHPGLTKAFRYLVTKQVDEFRRLYGRDPDRIDGHHHMHLCTNVLASGLLPQGVIVRRNFSFERGEKSAWNRLYRGRVDKFLARRNRVTDLFFALPPLESGRLTRIFGLGRRFSVEIETHPAVQAEYDFMMSGQLAAKLNDFRIARTFAEVFRERV